ncbi:MAG: Lrp/AsnC family transcriptional regulator [Microthrixaceae bacterium]
MANLDAIDHSILSALQSNARMTNKALASAVGVAPSTCLDRVRSLEQSGVISGYGAEVDPTALGRPVQAMVAVRLRPKTADVVESFLDAMWEMPETLSVTLVTGVEDALVHMCVESVDNLRSSVLDRVARAPGVVDERTSLVFEHRRRRVLEPLHD